MSCSPPAHAHDTWSKHGTPTMEHVFRSGSQRFGVDDNDVSDTARCLRSPWVHRAVPRWGRGCWSFGVVTGFGTGGVWGELLLPTARWANDRRRGLPHTPPTRTVLRLTHPATPSRGTLMGFDITPTAISRRTATTTLDTAGHFGNESSCRPPVGRMIGGEDSPTPHLPAPCYGSRTQPPPRGGRSWVWAPPPPRALGAP
jgi:hypothetical protein